MAIRDIITMETPGQHLDRPSEPVAQSEFGSDWLMALAQDLHDTLNTTKASGIAAPQIGVYKCVIAFGGKLSVNAKEFKSAIPSTLLVNPSYQPIDNGKKVELWEHCLSFPGRRGRVQRPYSINYSGYTVYGEKIEQSVDGLLSILVQHEIDHLNGHLFTQYVMKQHDFGEISAFEKRFGADHHIKYGLKIIEDN